MEKLPRIKEKLEEIRERSDDIAQNHGEDEAYDACDIIRGLSMEALSLIAEMEGEGQDMHPDTEADGIVFCGKCGKMR